MNNFIEQNVSLEKCPALVLNADYRPLSYYPLSLWSWQDTVKSVFLDRVIIAVSYTHLTLPTNRECRSRWSPYH